ncbi:hypothetical protein DFH08DRAFT_685842 [Mycena albidolilacea]|uniref:RlpA-like protein double-psi beta-barrel domain-containing protein n=1 Tax=Mycena albidolilacea TaxID=1033008 RepID=A0AAD7AIW5_9AGAR|nr:hypothetical protein DFH08DRAFT_685842 [Mycena albidolilacea]
MVRLFYSPPTNSYSLATWYTPKGNYGAYGAPRQNSDLLVALSSAHYHSGATHPAVKNGNHIDVTVGDLCPGCRTGDIDLSDALLGTGRIPVQWHFK